MITGCDTKACPKSLLDNLEALNVQLHGLNLMSLQNHRVLHPRPSLDVEFAFHNCESFFPTNYRDDKTRELIEVHGLSPSGVHRTAEGDRGTWTPYWPSDDVLVP